MNSNLPEEVKEKSLVDKQDIIKDKELSLGKRKQPEGNSN